MKATIIIPNYNGKHFLGPCLESLSGQTCRDFKILVVDNASTDGSIEYLKSQHPETEIIACRQNYGFSGAVNKGIRHSRTPYVILLNNDTVVDAHFVEEMLRAIEQSPAIFSVSSKMLQLHRPELIDSAGDLYTILGWGVRRGTDRPASNYTKESPVFSACAGAAIYRRSVLKRIGYFDESHFAYLEDIDIGYRAKICGYRNLYCPSALVYHVGSGTSGSKYNSFKVRLSARNSIYLNYKNMPAAQLALNFLPLLAGCLMKYAFFTRIGFGKDYKEGICEGVRTRKAQRKVVFRLRHLMNYTRIEFELIFNTFTYIKYIKDWVSSRLLRR